MKEPRKLWAHQEKAVHEALRVRDYALFHEMGTGKSGSAINILRHRYAEKGHIRKTLLLSPKITLQNWREEIQLFSKINDRDVVVLDQKSGAKKLTKFLRECTDGLGMLSRNRIVITNYEALQNENLYGALKSWNPEILVLDEAHRVRNHKAKRSKLCMHLADTAQHRYILTGTPILNSAQDIFQLYRILDSGKTFGPNFFAFRNRYFEDLNASWSAKPGYFPDFSERVETFGELHEKMYRWPDGRAKASRVLKKDCLDLPPLVRTTYYVEMGTEQAKIYKEMKDEFLTFVEREKEKGVPLAVVANLAITKALRLLQIISGFVKAEDGNEYEVKDSLRLSALEDLLEDATAGDQKVIVWATFKQNHRDIARLCEKMKLGYAMLNGETKDKDAEMNKFRTDKNTRVIICNQQAAGVGVNLVEASTSIFYSRNFSLEQDLQAEARNYRGGSERHTSVNRIDLVVKDSIDSLVLEALASKQNLSDIILDLKGRI